MKKNRLISIAMVLALISLSFGIDAYAADQSSPTFEESCRGIEKVKKNKENKKPVLSQNSALIVGYCEGTAKQFISRYGNTIAKTISEGYGNDVETSYSPESFCYNANLLLDNIPDIMPLLYVIVEPYSLSMGRKADNLDLLSAFGGLTGGTLAGNFYHTNSSMIDVFTFMTIDIEYRGLKKTDAYNQLFGALYRGNYKKALDVVAAYAQREDVKKAIRYANMYCGWK